MQSRVLGKGSLVSSTLAYGCWRLAGSEGSESRSAEQRRHGIRAVLAAAEAGYTFFDLADIYGGGECERIFGAALNETPGMRESIRIATKCGIRRPGDPDALAPYRYDFSAQYILHSVEGSLQRMGIGQVDLLMLHRPDLLMHPEEVAGAFSELQRKGQVREFGVSNFTPSQVALLQSACPMPLVVNQVEISLARLAALQDGTLDWCLQNGVTAMAWSPLDKGRLGGGVAPADPKAAGVLTELRRQAECQGATVAAVALAWLLAHPARILPVIGSTDPEHIRAATKACDLQLRREDWYRLTEAANGARLP